VPWKIPFEFDEGQCRSDPIFTIDNSMISLVDANLVREVSETRDERNESGVAE